MLCLAAGCGGAEVEERRAAPPAEVKPGVRCFPIDPGRNALYLLCRRGGARDHGWFAVRGRGRIPIEDPPTAVVGHWAAGFLSPDGRTLLVQWSAECEVPFAFAVPARGGTPRLVLGGRRLDEAQPSIAHGWTLDGRAIVEVVPGCGNPRAESKLRLVKL
jgi:hypothetical protein